MRDFIVRIKTYKENHKLLQVGTGIVIEQNVILTADHVVNGLSYEVLYKEQAYGAELVKREYGVAVLKTKVEFPQTADCFSNEEILDRDSLWTAEGYITEIQLEHTVSGKGFQQLERIENDSNVVLEDIYSGYADDYSGMSGAPVFCDDRIVGILQMQRTNIHAKLGLRMLSIETYMALLPEKVMTGNRYLQEAFETFTYYTQKAVQRNIDSRKYIPEIFVEQGEYKENVRYFADPHLFVTKVIEEIQSIDFVPYNEILKENGKNEIYIEDLVISEKIEDIAEFAAVVSCRLKDIENKIELVSELIQKEEIKKYNNRRNEYYKLYNDLVNCSIRFNVSSYKELLEYAAKDFLVITKEAGQGKTNFLCDFTSHFLLKKNYFTLYFDAYDFDESPVVRLKRELTLNHRYSFEYVNKVLEQEWKRSKHPLVIVIDGLNENTVLENFSSEIRNFLNECSQYPYIKVIMTTRKEFYEERFGKIEQGIYEKKFQKMEMFGSHQDTFHNRIFWGYLDFFDITLKDNSVRMPVYETLTNDILLLRFFCEVYEHQKEVYLYDVYLYDVFEKYIQNKKKEYSQKYELDPNISVDNLLCEMARYMLEKDAFSYVPLKEISSLQHELLKKMLNNEVIFKDIQKIKAGLLDKEATVIGFTFDEFRDFCITNYILEFKSEETVFYECWNHIVENNLTIREGVGKYLFFLSYTKYRETLWPMVRKLPNYEKLYWAHIAGVQDLYLDENDREKWKDAILNQTREGMKLVGVLISRCDETHFKNINVTTFYQCLDCILPDKKAYRAFIRLMFDNIKQDRYNQPVRGSGGKVYPLNYILKNIEEANDNRNYNHKKCWLMLSVYLYELSPKAIKKTWLNYFTRDTWELVYIVLKDMNKHQSRAIQANVAELTELLLENTTGSYHDMLSHLLNENEYYQSQGSFVNMLDQFDFLNKL